MKRSSADSKNERGIEEQAVGRSQKSCSGPFAFHETRERFPLDVVKAFFFPGNSRLSPARSRSNLLFS